MASAHAKHVLLCTLLVFWASACVWADVIGRHRLNSIRGKVAHIKSVKQLHLASSARLQARRLQRRSHVRRHDSSASSNIVRLKDQRSKENARTCHERRNSHNVPVVVERYKLVFFTTPGVAHTEFEQLLRRMSPDTSDELTYLDAYPFEAAYAMLRDDSWTKAIFFRSPVKRFVSGYSGTANDTDTGLGTFVDKVESGWSHPSQAYWKSQCEYVHLCDAILPFMNFVGDFDNLANDTRRLLERVGAWKVHGVDTTTEADESLLSDQSDNDDDNNDKDLVRRIQRLLGADMRIIPRYVSTEKLPADVFEDRLRLGSVVPATHVPDEVTASFADVQTVTRKALSKMKGKEWIKRIDWETPRRNGVGSYFNYGLPASVYDIVGADVGPAPIQAELIALLGTRLAVHSIRYLEIGVSVGKTLWQMLHVVSKGGLVVAFDIEHINPTFANLLSDRTLVRRWINARRIIRTAFVNEITRYRGPTGAPFMYVESDEYDSNGWRELRNLDVRFNLILSDAMHTPSALLQEVDRLIFHKLIDFEGGFAMVWDDVEGERMQQAFVQCYTRIAAAAGDTEVRIWYGLIGGWLGRNEHKHGTGVVTTLDFNNINHLKPFEDRTFQKRFERWRIPATSVRGGAITSNNSTMRPGEKVFMRTYGTAQYARSLQRLVNEATRSGWFLDAKALGSKDLPQAFVQRFKEIMRLPRGAGYWIWKYAIYEMTMAEMNEGDFLVYLDAGCTINPKAEKRFYEYIDMLRESEFDVLSFKLSFKEHEFTTGRIFEAFGIEKDASERNTNHLMATVQIFRKGKHFRKYLKLIQSVLELDPFLITDRYNTEARRIDPRFRDNRHDQSLTSVALKVVGSIVIADETYPPNRMEHPFWASRIRN